MRLPFWLLRLLPMWDYICPRCRREVPKNSHRCPHCGERYPTPLKLPPTILKDREKLERYVHEVIFPNVSQAHRDYLAHFFTVVFSDDFESGDFTAWTGTTSNQGGQPTVQSTIKHHGTYAMQCALTQNGYQAYAFKDVSSGNTFYVRAYVRFNKYPTTGESYNYILMMYRVSDGYGGLQVNIISDGEGGAKFTCRNNYYGNTVNGAAAQIDTWYCVETLNLQSGTQRWWINGVEQPTVGYGAVAMDRVKVGFIHASGSTSTTIQIDCVVVADAYIGTEGAIIKEVADSLGLSEAALRHKLLSLSDSLGLSDVLSGDKTLALGDSASLSELVTVIISEVLKYVADSVNAVDLSNAMKNLKIPDLLTLFDAASTPSRVLRALDAVVLGENSLVNKTLEINEAVSFAEVVDVGAGGVKRTRLFLVLGDLAVQLTGD